jgi:hypothetical protein
MIDNGIIEVDWTVRLAGGSLHSKGIGQEGKGEKKRKASPSCTERKKDPSLMESQE